MNEQWFGDFRAMLIGLVGGWLTRRWLTPREKAVGDLEILGKLAKELDLTQDQLIESFRDVRIAKRRMELLFGYLIQTLERDMRHGLKPLPLPAELESDPELVKFFKPHKGKR